METIDGPEWEDQEIVVDKGQDPIRLDKYLMTKVPSVTRNKIQNGIKAGEITVNDKHVKPNHILKGSEIIQYSKPKSPYDGHILKEDIPLDIIFEDEYILVVNKPPGMVVHPGHGNYSGTLVNAVAFYLNNDDLPVMEGNTNDRVGLVHRIDKDTSGLLVLAKTELAMTGLAKQFYDHTIDRKYRALIWGEPDDKKGTIEGNIGRNPHNRIQQVVFPDGEDGKHAVTHYTLLQGMYYVSLIECELETGRTHQIRAHMKHIGHPLFNDSRYGGDKILKGTVFSKYKHFVLNCFKLFPRQALHAFSLGFEHPITGERMYFEAPIPENFEALIEKWNSYLSGRKEVKGNEES